MKQTLAELHIRALPHTRSSRRGVTYITWLYTMVERFGFVHVVERNGRVVGVVSGIGRWILTLLVDPAWQRQGIGSALLEGLPGRRYVYTEASSVGFYTKLGFRRWFSLGNLIFLWRN